MNNTLNFISMFLLFFGCILIAISFFIKSKDSNKNKVQNESTDVFDTIKESEHNSEINREETTQKLLAINEYSDFVLEEIEKKHKELLFMYQLINEKEKKVNQTPNLKNLNVDDLKEPVEKILEIKKEVTEVKKEMTYQSVTMAQGVTNNNQVVLQLFNEGKDVKEIAKALGIGIGEVKLVLDLFKEVKDY
ncbi:hypothetical protein EDC18_104222 [Natranaerovirga pectinivora]|uniref:Uncharacterized protein n=1 Tax=Natranaerovirga pectinivora TaxID=682400 RepID=A0A4R3MQ07_9FIRM|nr:DUF6115 domain-containing protein [Natranaerovirga pectinivora]TCT15072.1 hypothetical protein EDC18_104222 [Natranaerovirga pectinivora]